MTHQLKISLPFADALIDGSKTFEVRKNDRGFNAGDYVHFTCWSDRDNIKLMHGINDVDWRINYVLSGWGIEEGYVVFSLEPVRKVADE